MVVIGCGLVEALLGPVLLRSIGKRSTAGEALLERGSGGRGQRRRWRIELDGRPVRTPSARCCCSRARPRREVAAEWKGRRDGRPARHAADRPRQCRDRPCRARPAAFADGLARYANSDLLCYRADSPAKLVAAQAEAWDPLLQWARRRFDVDFQVTSGVAPVDQPGRPSTASPRRCTPSTPIASPACRRSSPSAARWSPPSRCSKARSCRRHAGRPSASTSAGSSNNGARTRGRKGDGGARGRLPRRRPLPRCCPPPSWASRPARGRS
jgi:hypothetical protein